MSDKYQGGVLAGSVDVSLPVFLQKTADSTEQTGKVAADMTLSYWRQGGVRVAVTASDLAAVNSAHSDGGVKEVDATNMAGSYRVDWPDAAFATGADWAVLTVKVAASFVWTQAHALTTNVVQTGDSFVRIGAAGAGLTAIDLPNQTMDITGNITGNLSGSVGSVTGAVGSVAGAVGSVTGNVGGNVVGTVASVIGAVASVTGLTAADVGAIKAKTDSLTFTVANKVDANQTAINGDATSAANLAKTTRAIGRGTVAAAATTTSIPTSAFTPAGVAANQFNGRIITFDADTTTTALRGQSTDITASSAAATPTLTVTALTTAPASGDSFSVT